MPLLSGAAEYSHLRNFVFPIMISSPSNANAAGNELIVGSGSAVLIQAGYMLTAAHVVPASPTNKMFVVRNEKLVQATPVKIDRSVDLALLAVDAICPCATLAGPERIEIDSPVLTIGFPLYMAYGVQLISTGNIQGQFQSNIVSNSVTAPGGSGGGLFSKLDSQYKLIGITVAIASSPIGPRVMNLEQEHNWVSFSVPASAIRTFLKGTSVKI